MTLSALSFLTGLISSREKLSDVDFHVRQYLPRKHPIIARQRGIRVRKASLRQEYVIFRFLFGWRSKSLPTPRQNSRLPLVVVLVEIVAATAHKCTQTNLTNRKLRIQSAVISSEAERRFNPAHVRARGQTRARRRVGAPMSARFDAVSAQEIGTDKQNTARNIGCL